MSSIVLRPDLKTSGGEIHDILINGRFAGSMTLVFREGDRIGGSVQLDRTSITKSEKEDVVAYVRNYIQDVIMAVRAADCDVVVTNSPYDHIISTSRDELGNTKVLREGEILDEDVREAFIEEDTYDAEDLVFVSDEDRFGDEDAQDLDRMEMNRQPRRNRNRRGRKQAGRKAAVYELVIVGESRNKVEYHVYDHETEWVAEAFFTIRGTDCFGELNFMVHPSEEEVEAVVDLIVSDFDQEQVDTFDIHVKYRGSDLEHIELTHDELIDTPVYNIGAGEDDFTVTLARDDGDMLTYEIYNQARGGLPIGTATVDIANRQLSGFIEFREMCTEEERELIATMLMRELDKEKDYQTINLSIMHQNEKIDELMFETEAVH